MSDHTPVDDPLECPECQARGFTVGHSIPSAAMVEAASLIDALQRQAHRAPRPVTRDCLIAFIEIIYQHSPIMGGYQPPLCKCGNAQPCPDYERVRTLVESWGLL